MVRATTIALHPRSATLRAHRIRCHPVQTSDDPILDTRVHYFCFAIYFCTHSLHTLTHAYVACCVRICSLPWHLRTRKAIANASIL